MRAATVATSLHRPIVLLSPENAARVAGGAWWAALLALIGEAQPFARIIGVIDSDADLGAALGAIRAGCGHLLFRDPPPALTDFALANLVTLYNAPGPVLDVDQADDAAIASWLGTAR